MKEIFRNFLFSKNILVGGEISKNTFEVRFALANQFNVSITSGQQYAHEDMIPFVAEMLGIHVPEPFYRNFPRSVRALSSDVLAFDQLLQYAISIGFQNFTEAGHSLFEQEFERIAFHENIEVRKIAILTEEEAVKMLEEIVDDVMLGTRPLNDMQYNFVKAFIEEYGYEISACACKDTATRLLMDTRDARYASFLALSDVVRLVDHINYNDYHNTNIKKLNLRNQDRKFITRIIDVIFEKGYRNVRECFEKKAIWCGLLHHIHYQPTTPDAQRFVELMRGKENRSVYSAFERAMLEKDIRGAVTCLREGKGSGALLRQLNYIVSRCESEEDVAFVMESLDTKNAIVLIQMLIQYANYTAGKGRTFKFSRYNKLKVHKETEKECASRRSVLTSEQVDELSLAIQGSLAKLLKGRYGKIYIDPRMYNIALPLSENTANGGYGVLPRGSRIHIEEGKKIRAFTYWERVNDIDLSVIGITEDGRQREFSWRTMYGHQSDEITFSGDQTRGFAGGSEFFDIDVALFKKNHPEIKYLVFCNNVYSCVPFSRCVCRAGYMLRDVEDSGEIFEPKTVKSSFTIDCDSTFAYLFGIDLENNDFVWLNCTRSQNAIVAGATPLSFLTDYFRTTSIINVGMLFEMLATETVDFPEEADVLVTDEELEVREGVEVIRSYSFERINAILSTK